METKNLAARVSEIAREIIGTGGLELVHVEIAGSSKEKVVRIYIDKEGGIVHEDCAFVSQSIEAVLDKEDPVEGGYFLEVSSPGIERGLYSVADFERFSGKSAKLKTFEQIEGQKHFRGKIVGVSGNSIIFDDQSSGEIELAFGLIKKANLEIDVEQELKAAKRRNKK